MKISAWLCLFLASAQALFGNTDPLQAVREQRFFAPDDGGAIGDTFGLSVAADAEWAVVGAPGDDSPFFTDEGSAYVLKRQSDGTWAIHQKLTLPMTEQERGRQISGIYFGQTVAISGDWIAVGAPRFQQTTTPRGRVVLFKRAAESWQAVQSIDRPSSIVAENLGSALALSGSTLLIGAPLDGTSGTPYVLGYNRVTTPAETWTLQRTLTGPTGTNSEFGRSLAIRAGNAIVGLPSFVQSGVNDRGEVREYSLTSGGLLATLRPPNRDVVLRFGGTLSVSGSRLLVGLLPTVTDVRPLAYLYERGASTWTQIGTIDLPSGVQHPSSLDCPVALTSTRAVVGATRSDGMTLVNVTISGGAVPALQISTGIFTSLSRSAPFSSPLNHVLAVSAEDTLASDVNITSAGTNSPPRSGGIVAITPRLPPQQPGLQTNKLAPSLSHLALNDEMGSSVAIFGDTAAVSAPRWNNNRGAVHVFTRQGFLWGYSHSLGNPTAANGGALPYGQLIAINRDWMAVNGVNLVHVYRRVDGVWARTPAYSIMARMNASAAVLNLELNQIPGFEDSLVVAYYGGTLPLLVERYRLTATMPELLSDHENNYRAQAHPIAVAGNLGLTLAQTGTKREVRLFATDKDPWLQQTRLLPLPGTDLTAGLPFSDGLTFDGSTVMIGDALHGGWPIAYQQKGKTWVGTELRDKTHPSPTLASFAARSDTSVLVTQDSFQVRTRQAGIWQLNQTIFPGATASRDRPQNLSSSALSEDTAVIGSLFSPVRYGMVSMHYLPGMEVREGPSSAIGLILSEGPVLNIGEIATGVDTDLRLTLRNSGGTAWSVSPSTIQLRQPLTNTSVQFDGMSLVPVSPSGSTPLILKIRPTQTGQQTMILDIGVIAGAGTLTSISVRFTAVSQPLLPSESPLVVPQLIALGQPMTLLVPDTISRSFHFQWFKEGRRLPGETQPFLHRPAVTSATAGTYEVEVTDASGAHLRIKDILVGVYEPKAGTLILRREQPFTLSVRAWGPGIQIQWLNGQDTPFIRGSRTPTLHVTRADHAPTPVTASLILGSTVAMPWQWDVVLVPYPEISFASLSIFIRNTALESLDSLVITSVGTAPVKTFAASSLPPGIKLDAVTGSITGTPTTLGTFLTTFTGFAADHQSHSVQVVIRVAESIEEAGYASGALAGHVGIVDTGIYSLLGLMRLQVSYTGSFSGSWLIGGQRLSFQGTLKPDGDSSTRTFAFKLPGIPGYKGFDCVMNQQPAQPFIELFMTATDTVGTTFDSRHELYPVAPATLANRALYSGRYSALMARDRSPLDPRPETAEGSGFMSFTIDSAMQSTSVGTLPDGTGFTSSGVVLDEGRGCIMSAYQTPGDWLAVSLTYQDNGTLAGTADWNRAPRPGSRLYPDGLRDQLIYVDAARYFPPAAGMTLLPSLDPIKGEAVLTLTENGSTTSHVNPFRLTPQHIAVFPAPNASRLRLDFYSPTGFCTGQFMFDDPLPGNPTQRVQRTSSFRGMLVPGLNRGEGLFLMPQLPNPSATPPTTNANSPILPGKVSITPLSAK